MQRRAIAFSLLFAVLLNPTVFSAAPALRPPASQAIPVAIVVTEGANVIDFAGPWEASRTRRGPGPGLRRPATVDDRTAATALREGGADDA